MTETQEELILSELSGPGMQSRDSHTQKSKGYTGAQRRSFPEDRGRDWTDAFVNQDLSMATKTKKRQDRIVRRSLLRALLMVHLALGLVASKTMGEKNVCYFKPFSMWY